MMTANGTWLLLLGLALVACDGSPPADDDDDIQLDDDDDVVGDDDSAGPDEGLLGREGTATVLNDSYEGTEDLFFATEYGLGEDLCRIRYSLSTVAVRDDCEDCVWAFDLQVGAPELIAEAGPGCLATVGVDGATLAGLEGTVVAYGYNPDYFGHIQVLYVEQEGAWGSVGHASWDSGSGEFSYDWEDGYHPY